MADYSMVTHEEKERQLKALREEGRLRCVICMDPIPDIRLRRRAVTCCPEHSTLADAIRRDKRTTGAQKCRLCGRPSTPEEVEEFRRWRKETGQMSKRGRKSDLERSKKAEATPETAKPS